MTTVANQPDRPLGERRSVRATVARLLRVPAVKAVAAAAIVASLVILLRVYGWLQPGELLAYDTLRVAWAGHATSNRIVLIGASEADIAADDGNRWPWPLPDDKLAAVLERLAAAKPRAVGVDIYRDIPIFRGVPKDGEDPLDAVLKRHPGIYWVFRFKVDKLHPGTKPPKLLRGTERAVFSDIPEDSDGIVRRGLLFQDDGKNSFTGLATALALAYLAPEHIAPAATADDALRLGKAVIEPLGERGGPYASLDSRGYQVLFDYHGGPQPFREIGLSEAMDGDLAPLVRDKVVILGVDADSVKDSFSTPFSTGFNRGDAISGIAMHAHLTGQLIREALGESPVVTDLPQRLDNLWIVLWALGGAMLGLLVRSTLPVVAGSAAGVSAIAAVVYVAFGRALLLPAIPAMLAWLGSGVLTNQLLYAASNRARARLRQSFERYLPPAVVDKLVKADSLPALGGERREISVLFTDVASFTSFSEGRDPEELAGIANQYFDGVCEAVFRHEGLVNSFMGDGVLAFFGAPQPQPDHADRAVGAALDINRFAEQFSREQNARGVNFGHTRIGIHTGIAFVGNVGSQQRLQYTALGDILNTGSRLEGLNKIIGTRICVSRDVVEKCLRHHFRPVGEFIVMGRRGATEVYAPVDPDATSSDVLEAYESAYHALDGDDEEAARRFAELYYKYPDDACIAFHYHRLRDGARGKLIEMQRK